MSAALLDSMQRGLLAEMLAETAMRGCADDMAAIAATLGLEADFIEEVRLLRLFAAERDRALDKEIAKGIDLGRFRASRGAK